MSKAILVMDMPESCSKCPCFFGAYTDMVCRANNMTIDYPYPDKNRQKWCPLKPMTKKVDNIRYLTLGDVGWNDCIDAILKEGGAD